MQSSAPGSEPVTDAQGRPTTLLPRRELLAMSAYWLGLSSIFLGLNVILTGRLEFTGLVGPGEAGGALFLTTIGGAIIAMLVQPTIGSISDYTTSRWGRRKPYILIGSVLDVVFLVGIALSNDLLAIAAFISLLQFSSNFAQGPFQGYIPDLVPAQQVGLASALVGLFQVLGNVAGAAIGAIAVATDQFALGLIALGVFELATMVVVFVGVREGRTPKPRGGRTWLSIAREAWGTDIFRERSFLWLVGSRLAILTGGAILVNLGIFYFTRSHGLSQEESAGAILIISAVLALCVLVSVVPAARVSDRFGRKKVIYASCAIGAVGLGIVAAAPTLPIAYLGVAIYGVSAGIFLAVDWALMTDIIPKASSGRFMGLSNVATASAGVLATAFGGALMDFIGGKQELGIGPRSALVLGVALLVIGAVLLRPVIERRRDEPLHPDLDPAADPAPA